MYNMEAKAYEGGLRSSDLIFWKSTLTYLQDNTSKHKGQGKLMVWASPCYHQETVPG